MPFNNHTPFDYIPRRLYLEEIGNPILAINKFFDWENLPAWRAHLDKWLYAGLTPGFQLSRDELVELFVRYEFIEILIEALSLIDNSFKTLPIPDFEMINSIDNDNDKLIPTHINYAEGYFNNGFRPCHFDEQEYYPIFLNDNEKKQPYNSIQTIFKTFNLPKFRDALYWWYIVGIDSTTADDSRGEDYLRDLHFILQKAIELSHLIHIRTEKFHSQN